MTTNKPTKKWHVGRRAGEPCIYDQDGMEVATINSAINDEWRENMKLIQYAPDLLAALEGLLADPYLSDPINRDRMAHARMAVSLAKQTENK